MEPIPSESRALIETAGQILRKEGCFRDRLLRFISESPADTEKQNQYIDSQYQMVKESSLSNPEKRFNRSVSHMKSFIKIMISVQWIKVKDIFVMMWCIEGPDLQETFRFLPRMLNPDGSVSFPLKGTHHSRFYYMDKNYQIFKRISLELRMLQVYISVQSSRIVPRSLSKAEDVKTGVLDLDIEVDLSLVTRYDMIHGTKFIDLIRKFRSSKGNPYKVSNGVYIYNKNGTQVDTIDRIFKDRPIHGIFGTCINMCIDITSDIVSEMFSELISCNQMGLMAFNRHLMFWVRINSIWYLCDPWKKTFRADPKIFDDIFGLHKATWEFLPRSYSEQYKTEGSCAIASLSRLIQIGLKQDMDMDMDMVHLINEPIEDWAALLSACLIRDSG
jgi:hypothetical protein